MGQIKQAKYVSIIINKILNDYYRDSMKHW